MNEREIQAEWEWRRYRRRRRRLLVSSVTLAVFVSVVAAFALLGKLPSSFVLSPSPAGPIPPDALFVNTGLARTTVTRAKVVVHSVPSTRDERVNADTPDVVTALLQADPQDGSTQAQFPAAQIQLTASPLGRGRVQVSTVIDPGQAQNVPGGTYRATIQVFAGTEVLQMPLVLYLAPRDGTPALLAFLLLLAGASVGLGVKWITESLSRLAAARWRLEDLRRSMGGDPSSLPLMAAVRLEEIEDRIRRQDTDDLDKAFAPLVSNVLKLRSFATAVRAAEEEVDQQRNLANELDMAGGLDRDFVLSIARAETVRIERFRAVDWPWDDPDATVEGIEALAEHCANATLALSDVTAGRGGAWTLEVLDLFRKGEFDAATALYRNPPLDEGPPPSAETTTSRTSERPRRYFPDSFPVFRGFVAGRPAGLVPWMAQRPRWFAGAASVLVVSLVGLQLQYLGAAGFTGALGDWLGLLLWAAVVELSGVSVLDVLSRLGGGNVSGGGASRPPSATR